MAKGRRRSRIKSGARAVGRWSVQGAKGSAAASAAGVVTYLGVKQLSSRVALAQKHPIATPLAVVVGGHFVKRKYQSLGAGMIGAGAALAALGFDLNRSNPAPAGGVNALTPPQDIGALTPPQDIADPMAALDGAMNPDGANGGLYDYGDAMVMSQ